MPLLGSSTVVCLQQCRSVSFIVFLLFFHTLLHRLVIGPWSSSIQSIHLLFRRPLDFYLVRCTLLVSVLTFIHNTCPNHFNRICLLRLDTGTCRLIVSFVMLSLYAIRIILLSQRFSQASSQFSMCLVRLHGSLPYVNIGTSHSC